MTKRRVNLPVILLVLAAVLCVVAGVQLAQPEPSATGMGQPQEVTPTDSASTTPLETPTDEATEELLEPGAISVATYEVFLSRDPFQPVVPVADGDTSTTPATPTDGQPTGSPTTGPTTAPTTTPTSGPGGPGSGPGTDPGTGPGTGPDDPATEGPSCVTGKAVVCDGHVVELVDVVAGEPPTAVVRVDETAYEVTAGQAFAESFEVLAIEGSCATLLYGDDAFTLCEGESVLK